MTEEKLVEMVSKIDEKTSQTGLGREKTTNENEFQTILGRFVVRIREDYLPEQDGNDYTLTVTDNNGTVLESLTDSELANMLKRVRTNYIPNAFQVMRSIFKNAKRQAMGVDQAIDDILSELDNPSPKNPAG